MMTGTAGGPGTGISRLRGQQLARRELARPMYHLSGLARIWHDITHWFNSLLNTGPSGDPGVWGLTLLAVALVGAVAAMLYWLGPARMNQRARSSPVLASLPRTAPEFRAEADRLAARGDYGPAIVERVRAIAQDLETRQILLRRPARTARELAIEAGVAFPVHAAELSAASRLFDDVRYGGRASGDAAYGRVRDLDVAIAAAVRPAEQSGPLPAGRRP
jgi:hypothetical protein